MVANSFKLCRSGVGEVELETKANIRSFPVSALEVTEGLCLMQVRSGSIAVVSMDIFGGRRVRVH